MRHFISKQCLSPDTHPSKVLRTNRAAHEVGPLEKAQPRPVSYLLHLDANVNGWPEKQS